MPVVSISSATRRIFSPAFCTAGCREITRMFFMPSPEEDDGGDDGCGNCGADGEIEPGAAFFLRKTA